jgi:DNA-directed RNA polymerase specialized sigma24 family protein
MPISQVVSQNLPYLRRYARALTGSQAVGDAHVAATLEVLVKNPKLLTEALQPKVELFHLFSATWNAPAPAVAPHAVIGQSAVERNLGQITPRSRQAFLLVSVEGFSEQEAAYILDLDLAALRDIVDQAGRELAAQIATDILIIEDEALIALDLEQMVENLGHRVLGIARTRTSAVALARTQQPGLILADIQLADGSSGLDAVDDMLNLFQVPVIFITAYPERFLTGQRPEPAFLIAKPYQPATVAAVISQALFFERAASPRSRRAAG